MRFLTTSNSLGSVMPLVVSAPCRSVRWFGRAPRGTSRFSLSDISYKSWSARADPASVSPQPTGCPY
jgi:hypothetical protein